MPVKVDPNEKKEIKGGDVKASSAMTVLLGELNKVYYYFGTKDKDKGDPEVKVTTFSKDGIRSVLFAKKQEIGKDEKGKWKIVVLIKAMKGAKYKNMVDALDEMNIVDISRYAIVDVNSYDEELVKKSQL